ncbi:MAG: cytochrome c [Bauldia sp.]
MKRLQVAVLAAVTGAAALFSATSAIGQAPAADPAAVAAAVAEGAPLYARNCAGCHGAEGQGGAGPALSANQFVASQAGVVNQIFLGNAERGMPMFTRLSDQEVAAITNFVRNSWGNAFGLVDAAYVATVRPRE